MRAISCIVALMLMLGGAAAFAQNAQPEAEVSPDEKAIRAAVASYADAFNKHDAKALAAHWSETGEFITPAGKTITGRTDLEKDFAAYFAEAKNAKLTLGEPAIQFLSPTVAVEHGSALVVATDRDPVETDYEAIHIKTAEGWKMDSVREQEYVAPKSHYDRLQPLEWMIGEWVDADEEATVETMCRWTKNNNFITRSFRVHVEGAIELEGTQVIGWDPRAKMIRSWMFDSEGGFGAGAWSGDGRRWTVRSLNVLPDGRSGSATVVMEVIDDNTYTFHTIGREVEGELLPNIGPIKVIRK